MAIWTVLQSLINFNEAYPVTEMPSHSELRELHDRLLEPLMSMDAYTGKDAPFLKDTVTQLIPLLSKAFSSEKYAKINPRQGVESERNNPWIAKDVGLWTFTNVDQTPHSHPKNGGVKGEMLVALCFGPFFQWTLPACEYFTDIIVCSPNDKCIAELEKWHLNEPGAFDWSHAVKELCDHQGKGESWADKQNMWQKKIKQALKYDISLSNPLSPTVLPQADCLLLSHCLESHVTDKEYFSTALNNASSLLKTGGHLMLIACLEGTFYMVGSNKFPHLSIDEAFVRKALGDAGYDIGELQVLPRTVNQLHDVADYSGFIFVNALKR